MGENDHLKLGDEIKLSIVDNARAINGKYEGFQLIGGKTFLLYTDKKGKVHMENLDHVRNITVTKGKE